MYKLAYAFIILAVLIFAAPSLGLAQAPDLLDVPAPEDTIFASGPSGIFVLLATIIAWLFTLLLIFSVIFIILAAYNYLFSGGEEDKVKKAHKMLIYAVVALIVAFLARGVVFVVGELVGAPSAPTSSTGPTGGWTAWGPF